MSGELRYTLFDLWEVNFQLPCTSPLPNFKPSPQYHQRDIPVIAKQILPQLQVKSDGLKRLLSLSTIIRLKNKRKMLYFLMDSGELNIDGLVDTGALSGAIPDTDSRKIRFLAPHTILNEDPTRVPK